MYYGLKKITRKFRKYEQVKNIAVHQHTMLNTNRKKIVKALIGLIHEEGVEMVVATEERNLNVSKSVTMEHCFKDEGKQETTKKRKTPRWLLCTFKDRRKK